MLSSPFVTTFFGFLGLSPWLAPVHRNAANIAEQWQSFNASVGGRLRYSTGTSGPCAHVALPASHMKFLLEGRKPTQVESCQARAAAGGIDAYYLDARSAEDVIAVMRFVQRTGFPLVLNNFDVEFCSSPASNALAVRTHNIDEVAFAPGFRTAMCNAEPQDALLVGAGASLEKVYSTAERHGVTVVGGTSPPSFKKSNGILGDITSVLAPSLGSVIDNVLEFDVVSPEGKRLTVNACTNTDLWFALRGGGQNTFGIVTRVALKTHPKVSLVTYAATFEADEERTKLILDAVTSHAAQWAKAGWGGYITPDSVILTTPAMNLDEAREGMEPLSRVIDHLEAPASFKTLATQSSIAEFMALLHKVLPAGDTDYAISSRLIPDAVLDDTLGRQDVVKAIRTASRY
ncbi:hypothetical protein FRB99_002962, partial [Tulasnella sp. 403]